MKTKPKSQNLKRERKEGKKEKKEKKRKKKRKIAVTNLIDQTFVQFNEFS